MGFSKVYSTQTHLLKAHIVDIETDLSDGLHAFSIVGLPDKAVEEAKDRFSAAVKNSGFTSPKSKNQKVVVSLAPADIKKEGTHFDLGMALGYVLASGEVSFNPEKKIFIGELSLDGDLRPVHGILAMTQAAKQAGFEEIFVPLENANEATLVEGIDVYGTKNLGDIIAHLEAVGAKSEDEEEEAGRKSRLLTKHMHQESVYDLPTISVDFRDVRGQESAKRGLEIAAAGGHNIAMYGPPGTGKTMLARAFTHLLPPLSFDDALEVTAIHSVAGILKEPLIKIPPLRSPHHTSSHVSLVGGGANLKPGEITLAHKGVLFLDEFPEFELRSIESLRQPLEEGVVSISRAKGTAHFPARFILIAAMNPCPCGFYGVKGRNCTCNPANLIRYKKKLSGPLVDRIDLWVEVGAVPHNLLAEESKSEETRFVKERVARARSIAEERFKKENLSIKTNSELGARDIVKLLVLSESVKDIMNRAANQYGISARGYHRILKVARTIADLAESEEIKDEHILEAFQYRPKKQDI